MIGRNAVIPPVADYLVASNPNVGIRVTYSNGDMCNGSPRQTVYNLKCEKGANKANVLNVYEYPVCVYNIDIESTYACPGQKPKKSDTPSSPQKELEPGHHVPPRPLPSHPHLLRYWDLPKQAQGTRKRTL